MTVALFLLFIIKWTSGYLLWRFPNAPEWLLQIILGIYSSLWEIWHIRVKTWFWKLKQNWDQDEALTGIQKVREKAKSGREWNAKFIFHKTLRKIKFYVTQIIISKKDHKERQCSPKRNEFLWVEIQIPRNFQLGSGNLNIDLTLVNGLLKTR